MLLFQIQREVESFTGLKHSVFKNEEHLPLQGLDIAGYTSRDVFQVRGQFQKVFFIILLDGDVCDFGVLK